MAAIAPGICLTGGAGLDTVAPSAVVPVRRHHAACRFTAARQVSPGHPSTAEHISSNWRRRVSGIRVRALPFLETIELPLPGLGQLLPGLQGIPLPRLPLPLEQRPARSPRGSDAATLESHELRAVWRGQVRGLPPSDAPQPGAGNGRHVILQGFNWESCHAGRWYESLRSEVDGLAADGFTALWLPPPSVSVSPQGYLPTDLYNLDSVYGSRGELKALVRASHWRGMAVVADVVLNHRCATVQGATGAWNKFGEHPTWDERVITADSPDFHGRGAPSSGSLYAAAPNIDHTQRFVRNDYCDWLKWLQQDIGFDGWRLDFSLGYAGAYAGEYIERTAPALAFGEFWDSCDYGGGALAYNQDAHRHRLLAWCVATGNRAAAFDFTTKAILQEAVAKNERWRLRDEQGNPPGLIGLSAAHAVTFIDNHDTGSTLQHWPFPRSHLQEGYSYILSHPGTPCVFYDDLHDASCGPIIRQLMRMRRRNKLHAQSQVVIHEAREGLYVAVIDDRVLLHMGPDEWHPRQAGLTDRRWRRSVRGDNFVVWEKCSKRSRYSLTFRP